MIDKLRSVNFTGAGGPTRSSLKPALSFPGPEATPPVTTSHLFKMSFPQARMMEEGTLQQWWPNLTLRTDYFLPKVVVRVRDHVLSSELSRSTDRVTLARSEFGKTVFMRSCRTPIQLPISITWYPRLLCQSGQLDGTFLEAYNPAQLPACHSVLRGNRLYIRLRDEDLQVTEHLLITDIASSSEVCQLATELPGPGKSRSLSETYNTSTTFLS